ncbi:aspartic peptidase A1 [Cubamyces sp. BRFM 1775]|nr:aspartic peptidase A1 [Cubamyces sp. BRFM 1775]
MSPSRFSFSKVSSLLLVLSHVVITNAIPAATADATNFVTLPVAKRLNFTGSAKILQHDQARAHHLLTQAIARGTKTSPSPSPEASSIPAENQLVQYVANVRIGTPPTTYELIVDTGSSNTWIGAGQTYVQTSTTRQTRDQVSLTYGSGAYMTGVEFTDTINMGVGGLGLTVTGQSIGVAAQWAGFEGVDGVLGLGPTGLTVGTLSPDVGSSVPTVTDNLFSQGYIASEFVSIYFRPAQANNVVNGVLTFGDTYMYGIVGAINYAPITTTSPSSAYWGINQGLRYGTSSKLLGSSPGIFDTRTTLILLATDVLTNYIGLVGAEFDETTNFFRITPAQYTNLQSLFFTIDNVIYEFTANAQIWPRNLNGAIGGSPDYVYLVLGDIGWSSGLGMDFINGMTFIERYYMIFDTENHRVGIANTPYTRATTN